MEYIILLTSLTIICLLESKQPDLDDVRLAFNISCDQRNSKSCQRPSKSLEEIADDVMGRANIDVLIDIKVRKLYLNRAINFSNLRSLTINGEPDMAVIECSFSSNRSDTGIILSDILDEVSLRNLKLISCGSLFKNVFKNNQTFMSALTLVHCSNVVFNLLVLESSRGIGLMIVNHKGGRVNINSSTFRENKLPQEYATTGEHFGGGGVYVLLGNFLSAPHTYTPMTFQFFNCTFLGNVAHTKYYNILFTDIMGKPQDGYGRGGGAYVSVKNGLDHVHMSFIRCEFIANRAFIGGGLSVRINGGSKQDVLEMKNVTVEVHSSLFKHNGCGRINRTYFGGGLHLSFSLFLSLDHSVISDCHYLLRNVSIIENCADVGGGVVYSSDRLSTATTGNSMLFDNCTFKQNTAQIGSALCVTRNPFFRVLYGFAIVPAIKNCYFLENSISKGSQLIQTTAGIGTVYASLSEVQFQGCNHFANNVGSAIYVVNGIVNFHFSSVHFVNNTGLHGGAIALIGSSTIIIGANDYEFIDNKALYQGGAVYVYLIDSTDFISSRSCFIQYRSENNTIFSNYRWNANITFIGNRARDSSSGHAIYATSLHPCQVLISGTPSDPNYELLNISDVFYVEGVNFDSNQMLQPQIATDGAQLHQNRPSPLFVIPGEKYKHGVTITDDFGVKITTLFRASINGRNTNNIQLDPALSSFVRDNIQLRGKPQQIANLNLRTVSPRQSSIRLRVILVDCPPGFKLNINSQCVCNVEAYVGLFKCDSDNFYSHILPGYWAGLLGNESGLVTISPCPFCDYSSSGSNSTTFEVVLPQAIAELDVTVCGETRTGIACGLCQSGYTVHFHSPGSQCKPTEPADCKLGWLFYILSELMPVTAVFITVLVLNISFTSGTVNGFILFSQLLVTLDIDASGIISFPKSAGATIQSWTQGYKAIYGFLNLDYFSFESISFCLWKGATALDMLAFKYVTILYALLLMVTVILIMNQCGGRCLGKICRITTIKTSVVHGISTFLVICYSQCIKVSLSLLIPIDIHPEESSSFRPEARVLLNGNILYFSSEHLRYALPALFCLLSIGLVPPIFLLAYPLLNKVLSTLGCENIKIIDKLSQKLSFYKFKPIFDSIQGCFKDNFRFFAGLYFLYRWIILIVYMNTNGFSAYYTAVGCVFLFILTLHTICQPYISRIHNITDTLLFADLVLINSLSFFNYYRSRTLRGIELGGTVRPATVQLVLIYLPIVVMCVYLVIVLCKSVQKYGCQRRLPSSVSAIFPGKNSKLRKLVRMISTEQDDLVDSDDEEFTHDRHIDERSIDGASGYYLNADNESETIPFSTYT